MRLILAPKHKLTDAQNQHLSERLADPEHQNDNGPIRVWDVYQNFLYAFINKASGMPVAIAEASGHPRVPAWWIDSLFRGQGLGNELVDLLADQLKAEGVTAIGRIPIDTYLGNYNEASSKLAKRMHRHFE